MRNMILMMLPLCGLAALSAQSPEYSVGVGLIQALDGLKKVTHASTGLALEGAATMPIRDTASLGRLSLSANLMPGKQHGTAKSSLRSLQLSLDALLDTPLPSLRAVVGFSGNNYSVSNSGTETFRPETGIGMTGKYAPVDVWAVTDTRGLKLGIRLGLAYQWDRHLSGEFLFQSTELGGGTYETSGTTFVRTNDGPVNPSWFQFNLRYTF